MDMNMSQSSHSHNTSTADSMVGMASTFSINTHVTLWFTDWVTKTPAQYAFTVIFLFVLGLLNRFLGAAKSQLERRWSEQLREVAHEGTEQVHWHTRRVSRLGRVDDGKEELEPLSPAPPGIRTEMAEKPGLRNIRSFWIANAAWSAKRDTVRALFEFTRAVIGYILMLAVMTYNVGFFFAVTGSVLLGELVFGRCTQGKTEWQEGGCHE